MKKSDIAAEPRAETDARIHHHDQSAEPVGLQLARLGAPLLALSGSHGRKLRPWVNTNGTILG